MDEVRETILHAMLHGGLREKDAKYMLRQLLRANRKAVLDEIAQQIGDDQFDFDDKYNECAESERQLVAGIRRIIEGVRNG